MSGLQGRSTCQWSRRGNFTDRGRPSGYVRRHNADPRTDVAILLLLLVNALLPVPEAIGRLQPTAEEPVGTGYVLAPDGTPVSAGTIVAVSGFLSTTETIDRAGRFRFFPRRSGVYELLVSVPGLAPYRMAISIPQSRSLRLPVIRLEGGAYF